ncbi:MAG: UDP-2,3-diacylglucosamine diphosphatase [Syntrophales bacterium]
MTKAVFLSDAHLKNQGDDSYRYIMKFLDFPEDRIDDLFILGDLFDFWFCRDGHIYPGFKPIIDKLVDLKKKGMRIHLFEGNHDFFLGDYFTKTHGMAVFAEWANVNLDGRSVLISHGDTVDKTNKKYILLRKLLRSGLFYRMQRSIPSSVLWKIARVSSTVSKELTIESEIIVAKKMEEFALNKFREGIDAVIFGHCHIPLLKEYEIGGQRKTFVTLGDWIKHYSYLCYEDGRFVLSYYKPGLSSKREKSG